MGWLEQFFHPSDWEFTGSAGGSATVGVHRFARIGAGYLYLPIQNRTTGAQIGVYSGGLIPGTPGAVASIGLGAAPPVSADDISLPSFPAGGIGRIYAGPQCSGALTSNHFAGYIHAVSVDVVAGTAGHQVTAVFFLAWWGMASAATGLAQNFVELGACKAVGFLHGSIMSTSVGVSLGGGVFYGRLG